MDGFGGWKAQDLIRRLYDHDCQLHLEVCPFLSIKISVDAECFQRGPEVGLSLDRKVSSAIHQWQAKLSADTLKLSHRGILKRQTLGGGDSILLQMPFLIVLVLDHAKRFPVRLDIDSLANFFEHFGVDMLNLHRDDIGFCGQFLNRPTIFERPVNVAIVV
ncbi:hypothetical protein AC579_8185 [Pseudocercospora musae]|uniref:Uncharacterized protein n=1 Tax=Pseudocercospora musae TaxID=113226 RepID=A0A139IUF3_9PEZI|nr:hypothetical protein AC579_8185 [Pseudocercospora musae]